MGLYNKIYRNCSKLFIFETNLVTLSAARIPQRAVNWAFLCFINRSNKLSFLACSIFMPLTDINSVLFHTADTTRSLAPFGIVEITLTYCYVQCGCKIIKEKQSMCPGDTLIPDYILFLL
jgi:hypothetical protein